MKKTIKAVVIDDNKELVSDIENHFKATNSINIVASFTNGAEALGYIISNEENIDVIIMDILIPNLDGLSLLNELKNHNISKKIFVLSSFKDEQTIKDCSNLGVNYYLIKPISISSLERRILETFVTKIDKKVLNENLDMEISQLLHNLGIPSHIRGYKYIRDGIMIIFNNSDAVSFITKEIYPQIAMKYETTSSRVERAIRHAIEVSWLRGDLNLMEDIFGFSVSCDKAKPTNSEFLSTIAERIKITNGFKF